MEHRAMHACCDDYRECIGGGFVRAMKDHREAGLRGKSREAFEPDARFLVHARSFRLVAVEGKSDFAYRADRIARLLDRAERVLERGVVQFEALRMKADRRIHDTAKVPSQLQHAPVREGS